MHTTHPPFPGAVATFNGHRDAPLDRQETFRAVTDALREASRRGAKPEFLAFIASLSPKLRGEAREVLWSLIDGGSISLGVKFEITVEHPLRVPEIVWRDPAGQTISIEWDPRWI